jgi:Tol biopolymer transport system component
MYRPKATLVLLILSSQISSKMLLMSFSSSNLQDGHETSKQLNKKPPSFSAEGNDLMISPR